MWLWNIHLKKAPWAKASLEKAIFWHKKTVSKRDRGRGAEGQIPDLVTEFEVSSQRQSEVCGSLRHTAPPPCWDPQSQPILITHHNDTGPQRDWQCTKGQPASWEVLLVTKQGWDHREQAEASVFQTRISQVAPSSRDQNSRWSLLGNPYFWLIGFMPNKWISMWFCEKTTDVETALPLLHTSCLLPTQSSMDLIHHFRHSWGVKEPLPSLKSVSKFWKLVSLSVKDPHYPTYRIYRFF